MNNHNLNLASKSSNKSIEEINIEMHHSKQLNLPFLEKLILLSIMPRLRKDKVSNVEKLYHKGRKKISKYLDVDNYLNSLHKIEVINHLLFNEKQKSIINYVFKPNLSLRNNDDVKDINLAIEPYFSKVINEKMKSYNNYISNDGKESNNNKECIHSNNN